MSNITSPPRKTDAADQETLKSFETTAARHYHNYFSQLPLEIREAIYQWVFERSNDLHVHDFAVGDLQKAEKGAEPLLGMDDDGCIHREALGFFFQTKNVIFDVGCERAWNSIIQAMHKYGHDVFQQLRQVEAWAWDDDILFWFIEEMKRCNGLNGVKVLLGQGNHFSVEKVVQMLGTAHHCI